ncbi:MAG TPA: hypothetical protein EYQ83_06915 [Acidobacteria bacterium]|nr:hypothetical protein [Acidobacteriota bacterium]
MFVDEVDIHVTSGDGGRGCLSFHREKSAPRGGPDGGDGGAGGSVVLVAPPHVNTLVAFRFHRTYKATRGAHGEGSNRTGKSGKSLVLKVPVGTVAYEQVNDRQVQFADLRVDGQRVVVAREVGRHPIEDHADAALVQRVDQEAQPVAVSVA